jgi:hypothetical protein
MLWLKTALIMRLLRVLYPFSAVFVLGRCLEKKNDCGHITE